MEICFGLLFSEISHFFQLQLLHWLWDTSSYDRLIFSQTHSSFYLHNISCDNSYHVTTKPHPCLTFGKLFLFFKCFILPPTPNGILSGYHWTIQVLFHQSKALCSKTFQVNHGFLLHTLHCDFYNEIREEVSPAKSLMQITAILHTVKVWKLQCQLNLSAGHLQWSVGSVLQTYLVFISSINVS